LTLSAHKACGPKGAAALVLDKRVELQPLIAGGGHERGLRSGTENVAAIVGFGVAAELAAQRLAEDVPVASGLRAKLEPGIACWVRGFLVAMRAFANTSYFALPISMAKRWLANWTAPVLRWPAAQPVPAPIRSRRMFCGRWAWRRKWRAVQCGSVWGAANTPRHRSNEFINALQATVGRLQGLTAMAA
jgi:cysteine desulfurase